MAKVSSPGLHLRTRGPRSNGTKYNVGQPMLCEAEKFLFKKKDANEPKWLLGLVTCDLTPTMVQALDNQFAVISRTSQFEQHLNVFMTSGDITAA